MTIAPLLRKIKDVNALGEFLRSYAFTDEGYGGYSNFDLEPEFTRLDPTSPAARDLLPMICGGNSVDDEDDIRAEMTDRGNFWTNGEIDIAWYWDGDGTLLFRIGQMAIINTDCKKPARWDYVRPAGFLDMFASSRHPVDIGHAKTHPLYGRHNHLIHAIQTLLQAKKFDFSIDLHDSYQRILRHALLADANAGHDTNRALTEMAVRLRDSTQTLLTRYARASDRGYFNAALTILDEATARFADRRIGDSLIDTHLGIEPFA